MYLTKQDGQFIEIKTKEEQGWTFSPTEKSERSLLSLLVQITGRSVDNITVRSCKFKKSDSQNIHI